MKEWIEELLAEKAQMQTLIDMLMRVISYVDQEHDDDTPITHEALQEVTPIKIRAEEEGVFLDYSK